MRFPILHGILGLAAIGAAFVTYNAFDVTPPSFVIAMWPYPYRLHIGEQFVVTELFVRNYRCARFVNQAFWQKGIVYQDGAEPVLVFPRTLGLIVQKFEGEVPAAIQPGPAEYRLSLTWVCLLHPRSWFGGVSALLTYPVEIAKDVTHDCLPKETKLSIPGAEIEIKCKAHEKG